MTKGSDLLVAALENEGVDRPAALSALALCELAIRAGIPGGVLSCVTGGAAEIGGEMTSNPIVKKLTFTGSTEVGKVLMAQCARTVKRTSMELGGNAPFIVFDDADLDCAIKGAIVSKYRNAGQTCVCVNRILVQDAIHDAFVPGFSEAVRALKVGDGFDPDVMIGPLINVEAVEKVKEHITDATSKGARIIVGGRQHPKEASFFEPTVVAGATPDKQIFARKRSARLHRYSVSRRKER